MDSDPIPFRIFNEIGIINQLSSAVLSRVLPHGLSLAQFGVLNHFVRLGGERTPARLAAAFQVTRGAMTNTLSRLEAQGFVAIRPDPEDGRGKLVTITEAGRSAREEALTILMHEVGRLEGKVDWEAMAEILPKLTTLRQILDEERFKPGGQ
ncbi:MAG: MarR family transcriptional regulator [Pseudomonadota bacterium]